MHGIFDIIGPVMVGPSSSHTAGAARLGRMARNILGEKPVKAEIELHGSFAQTFRGHGTDRALAAGLLGFEPDDLRIRDAFQCAKEMGLDIAFRTTDLGNAHPNTAVMKLTGSSGRSVKVIGASIGGGNILVTNIDGYDVELSGSYPTLITIHQDRPGIIAQITEKLAKEQVNIAFMSVSRRQRGSQALMILEADQPIRPEAVGVIQTIPAVDIALLIPPL